MTVNRRVVNRIAYAMIIVSALILFGQQLTYRGSSYEGFERIEDGWRYEGEETSLPLDVKKEAGKSYAIEHRLPRDISEKDVVVFKSENIFWSVYVNGELLESFQASDVAPGSTAGDQWHIIMLPADSAGGLLRIEMEVPYRFGPNLLSEVFYANHKNAAKSLLRSFLIAIMLAVFTMALAVMTFLASLLLADETHRDYTLCWLGLFEICMAVWTVMQSPVTGILYGVHYGAMAVLYMSIPLSLGFAMIYCMCLSRFPWTWFNRLTCAVPFAAALIYPVLDVSHCLPFAESLLISVLLFLWLALMVVISTVRLLRKNYPNRESARLIAVGNIYLLTICVLDIYQSFFLHGNDYTGNTRVAMVVYLAVVASDQLMDLSEDRRKLEEARIASRLAYVDGLTGIANRMAFNKRLNELPRQEGSGFVSFDVNNLKTANDNYGHIEGDNLICLAANCISEAFEGVGTPYRYGGDEFFIILDEYDEQRLERAFALLDEKIGEVNEAEVLHVPMAIARGSARFEEGRDQTLTDTLNRADERMYENKEKMKGKGNIR